MDSSHPPQDAYAGLLSRLFELAGKADTAAFVRHSAGQKRGTCPFCGSSDGFSADDRLGIWHCFSCHAGGGVSDLARELDLDWKAFAADAGIKVVADDDKRPRASVRDVAATWSTATPSPVPAQVRAYATFRCFPEAFERGLARVLRPGDATTLPRACSHLASGDRIIVPLFSMERNSAEQIVALQARTTDFNREPKVVGAGPTKRAVFANQNGLRVLRGEQVDADVVLLEGLTDFLCAATAQPDLAILAIAGAGNAESVIGPWARDRNVYIGFDGDEAGRTATVAAAGRIHLWHGRAFVTPVTPGSDVAELVRKAGRDEFTRLLGTARDAGPEVEEYCRGDDGRWPEPVPYTVRSLPPFPVDALPPVLRDFAVKSAARVKVDVALPAWIGMASVSMACRDRLVLAVSTTWYERSNIFVAVIAEPGGRKSPLINPVVQYFLRLEKAMKLANREEIAKAKAKKDILRTRIKNLKNAAANATIPEDCAEAEQKLDQAQKDLDQVEIPPEPRLITNSASSAKLVRLLARHGVIGCFAADSHPFEIASGRWNADGAEDCDAWIAGWSGDSMIIDRTPKSADQGDGEHIVHPHPRLVALVGAQPAVLAKLGRKDHLRGIGFVARFFFIFPENLAGRRAKGISNDDDTSWRHVEELLQMLFDGLDKEFRVVMTPEARLLFEDYEAESDAMQAEGGTFEYAKDFASKFPSQLARLILILHAAQAASEGGSSIPPRVERRTVEDAIRIMRYAESHALAAIEDLKGGGDLQYVIRRIHELGMPDFTRRDLHRATQKRFSDAKGLDEPLRLLCDRGYVVPLEEESRPGRPPSRFLINPRALKLFEETAAAASRGKAPTPSGAGRYQP